MAKIRQQDAHKNVKEIVTSRKYLRHLIILFISCNFHLTNIPLTTIVLNGTKVVESYWTTL